MIKHFKRNTAGRDFAVGDIHGCFAMLAQALDTIGFDDSRDRLFSVGDLVDRGPDSEAAIDWINKPWFHAVRGNHEQMAIDITARNFDRGSYRRNGGEWFLRLTPERQKWMAAIFDTLPIAMDVDSEAGKIGFVHAETPYENWDDFSDALSRPISNRERDRIIESALWTRNRIMAGDTTPISDLYCLYVGHTPVERVKALANVIYIDTGAVFAGGHLTVLQIGMPPITEASPLGPPSEHP